MPGSQTKNTPRHIHLNGAKRTAVEYCNKAVHYGKNICPPFSALEKKVKIIKHACQKYFLRRYVDKKKTICYVRLQSFLSFFPTGFSLQERRKP